MAVSLSPQNVRAVSFEQKYQQNSYSQPFSEKGLKKDSVSFNRRRNEYENPVSRGWEYFSASIAPIITSAIVGGVAGFLKKPEGKLINPTAFAWGAGIALILTLPVALYHRKVSAFAKTKEMDVFARAKSAETSLSEQIDDESRDKHVSLDKSLEHYLKFQIGRNGNGMPIINT